MLSGGLLVALVGCAPPPSSAPLGLGPLALAEQKEEQAEATRQSHKPAKVRPARGAAAPSAAEQPLARAEKAKPDAKDDGESGEAEPAKAAHASAPADFEGMYAGVDVAVFRLSGFPEREQRDEKAKIRIEKAAAGNVSITLINSEDGSDLCELSARVDGNAALIESAQPCFSDGTEGSLEAELTSGRAVVEGDSLNMDAEGTLSVALPDQELDGELTYTFKGKRE